jgi:methylmalonyl-CoA mutase N-terminal domain/subunit
LHAWTKFQQLEKEGGWINAEVRQKLRNSIEKTAKLRVQLVAEKTKKLIGINIFESPYKSDRKWSTLPSYFGLPALNLEIA